MPSAEKLEKVATLRERIEGSEAMLLTEYRGLTVQDATELRRSLAEHARFAVVKNTLMKRAADEAGLHDLDELLNGPTAVAFVRDDVVSAAKRVVDAAKKFPTLVIKGAWMEGRVLSGEEARALADLESREVMLSKLAGLMKAEMARAAGLFQALQSRFLGVLEAYRDKISDGTEPSPEAPSISLTPGVASDSTEAPAPEASGIEPGAQQDEGGGIGADASAATTTVEIDEAAASDDQGEE